MSMKRRSRGSFRTGRTGRDRMAPIARGSVLGFFLGVIPGGTAVISSFVSYAVEKKFSKHPEGFGKGAIEGVAGPEAANNAATCGLLHPPAHPGDPVERGHGPVPGGPDDPRDHARARCSSRTSPTFSGG